MKKENFSFTNLPELLDLNEFLLDPTLEPKSSPLIEENQMPSLSQNDINSLIPLIRESTQNTSKYL